MFSTQRGCFVSSIARIRSINGFGQRNPRLDRFQGASEYFSSQTKPSFVLSAMEAMSFYASQSLFQRLTLLWNGRIVYQRHWNVFLRDMRRHWWMVSALVGILIVLATASTANIQIYLRHRFSGCTLLLLLSSLKP